MSKTIVRCPECDAILEECVGEYGGITFDGIRCPEGCSLVGHFGTQGGGKMKALFSIANAYDQPKNNLEYLFEEHPTLEQLAKAMHIKFPCGSDEATLTIVRLWEGTEIRWGETDYRLETVQFGKHLKQQATSNELSGEMRGGLNYAENRLQKL